MSSVRDIRPLSEMTWLERAEHYDRVAERYAEQGNTRDEEFARLNAKTMRLMAVEDGEVREIQ